MNARRAYINHTCSDSCQGQGQGCLCGNPNPQYRRNLGKTRTAAMRLYGPRSVVKAINTESRRRVLVSIH